MISPNLPSLLSQVLSLVSYENPVSFFHARVPTVTLPYLFGLTLVRLASKYYRACTYCCCEYYVKVTVLFQKKKTSTSFSYGY